MQAAPDAFARALGELCPLPRATAPAYDPLKTFAPLTLPDPATAFRSSNGAPGPMYWQNRVDYDLHASIDTAAKVLTCDETIHYTNNSPDTLPSLWIQLDQNIYRQDSRSAAARGAMGARRRVPNAYTDGYILDSVEVAPEAAGKHAAATVKAEYVVTDTRMQVRLPEPLRGKGGRLRVVIHYHYTIPGLFGGRTSWGKAKDGEIYDIAQWFPRMAVYDDLHGWDTQPYLGNEFYCEYGHIDYTVTVPVELSGHRLRRADQCEGSAFRHGAAALGTGARVRQDHRHPHGRGSSRERGIAHAGGEEDVALQHGQHARHRLHGLACVCVGCGADEHRGRQWAAGAYGDGAVGIPGGERGRCGMGTLDRVPEGRRRALLAALVSVPVSQCHQRCRLQHRHGISGHPF